MRDNIGRDKRTINAGVWPEDAELPICRVHDCIRLVHVHTLPQTGYACCYLETRLVQSHALKEQTECCRLVCVRVPQTECACRSLETKLVQLQLLPWLPAEPCLQQGP